MRYEMWTRLDHLVAEALDLPAPARPEHLAMACGSDRDLYHEAFRLVDAAVAAADFLEQPVAVFGAVSPPLGSPQADTTGVARLGERAGSYRLTRILGSGGMATVYLGERDDGQCRQQVAVKVIHNDGRIPEHRQRFVLERQVLAQLSHDSIARFYDSGTLADGQPYLVMEFVDGLPVDEYCDRHQLDLNERLRLFRQICSAVEYAHRNLLIHRDLKPANILVTANGTPKLLDFGIAKLLDVERFAADAAFTRTGLRPMTPSFASPEQIRGQAITTASDVYTLGILLYLLLAGRHPFRVRHALPHEYERAVLEEAPEKPSVVVENPVVVAPANGTTNPESLARARRLGPPELARALRGDLDTIVAMALRKRPERRYASVQQLSEDVARHLANRPVVARGDTLRYRLGKFLYRHRFVILSGGVVATVLIAFAWVTFMQTVRVARERDKAQQASDFFLDLFLRADPTKSRGRTITVREVLDRNVEQIGKIEDQPELRAAFMVTVGKVYSGLGLHDQAESLLRDALALRRLVLGETHREIAGILDELAHVLADQGRFAAAEGLYREALDIRRRLLDDDHPEVARSLDNLALNRLYLGKFDNTEQLFREALAIQREFFGEEHTEVATTLDHLAQLMHGQGELEEAEELYREALRMRQKLLGEDHFEIASTLNNLALTMHEKGDHHNAEELYRDSLAMRRKLFGDDHPDLATILNNLAFLLYEIGDYEAARPLYEEAMAIQRRFLGDEHHELAASINNLALVHLETASYDQAAALFRESIEMRRRLYGDAHPNLANPLFNLALLHRTRGDYLAAEPLYREVLEIDRHSNGDDHPNVAISLTDLSRVLHDLGRDGEAEQLIRQALAIFAGKFPDGHWRVSYAEGVLGACLSSLRRFDEAGPLLTRSYADLERRIGTRKPRTQDVLKLMIEHFGRCRLPEKAAELRRHLLSLD